MNDKKSFLTGLFPVVPASFIFTTLKENSKDGVYTKIGSVDYYKTTKYLFLNSGKPICKLINHGTK
ncbi:MAG: hypothetical protein HXX16_10175 [Bacteroidales bacterium]|nr:hypothetical protein [Bacteroidales bacterium]